MKSNNKNVNVFISYSRKDRVIAQEIANLVKEKVNIFKDTENILPAEEWKVRLNNLILSSDTVIFLLSPHSVNSKICAWEVATASKYKKRIIPIIIKETKVATIPPLLSDLNYVFAVTEEQFKALSEKLYKIINTDIQWIREHTRLMSIAYYWKEKGKPKELLLGKEELLKAKKWLENKKTHEPDLNCIDFIENSSKQEYFMNSYTESYLDTLIKFVGPLLKNELKELKEKVDKAHKSSSFAYNMYEEKYKEEILIIENFFQQNYNWHPQKAYKIQNLGPREDYLEVYKFPCCGVYRLCDNSLPSQFVSDGCQKRPI